MKKYLTNQKLTIAKLTTRLEESEDDAHLFSADSTDCLTSTNSNNPRLSCQKVKGRNTKGTTRF